MVKASNSLRYCQLCGIPSILFSIYCDFWAVHNALKRKTEAWIHITPRKWIQQNGASQMEGHSGAILADPCLQRFDHCKCLYLCTNFCMKGFAYVALQPSDNQALLLAMRREMESRKCKLLISKEKLTLHPIAFGSCKTRGKESKPHSYLGEWFVGDWAYGECWHMCWGICYTWVTDFYGAWFIWLTKGQTPVCFACRCDLWVITVTMSMYIDHGSEMPTISDI